MKPPHEPPSIDGSAGVAGPVRSKTIARRFGLSCLAMAGGVALVVLAGWVVDLPSLTTFGEGGRSMKANFAVGVFALAVAAALTGCSAWQRFRVLSDGLALLAVGIGASSLLQDGLGWDLGIDEMLVRDRTSASTFHPERPSPVTAAALFLCAASCMLAARRNTRKLSQAFAIVALGLAWFSVAGLIYGIDGVEGSLFFGGLSIPASLSLLLLSGGLLSLTAREGVMSLLLSPHHAGRLLRWLIPTGMALPVAFGWLLLKGEEYGWFANEVGVTFYANAIAVILVGVTLLVARIIDQIDLQRRQAEGETLSRLLETRSAEAALREAQEMAHLGHWEWSPHSQEVNWSEEMYRIAGLDPAGPPPTDADREKLYTPESLRRLNQAVARAIREGLPYQIDLDLLRPDGELRCVTVMGRPDRDENGDVVRLAGTMQDVTELTVARREIERTSQRLALATQAASIGIWDWDIEKDRLFFDPTCSRIYGLGAEAHPLELSEWSKFVLPDDIARVNEEIAAALNGTRDFDTSFRIRRPDGEIRHIRAHALIQRDGSGRPLQAFGTNADITERRLAQEELFRSRQMLESIVEHLPQRVFWKDATLAYLGCNRAAATDAGLSEPADIVGKTDFDLSWKAAAAEYRADDAEIIRTGRSKIHYAERIVRPDDSVMLVNTSKVPLRSSDGSIFGVLGTYDDVTEMKRAEAALRESEERFRMAVEYAPIGVALVGLDGRWLKVNHALCNILGYPEADLLGRTFQDITHPDDLEADITLLLDLVAGKITHYHLEKRYLRGDGGVVWGLLSVAMVRSELGEPEYFVSQVQDITARREAEQNVQASLVEKEVLLREVHHRVKNNMQVISSILQMQAGFLRDPQDRETFRDLQMRIQSMALVHERLYQSGNFSSIDFSDHLKGLAALMHRAQASSEKTCRLEIDAAPVTVNLDTAIPLGLIACELISNAFKHAFKGRSAGVVRVELAHDPASHRLVLEVRDDGCGLPEDFSYESGRSLGLRLIRALVRQLRATLEIESEHGTRFAVIMQIEPETPRR
jgi:PAS domain S-box-containing protein